MVEGMEHRVVEDNEDSVDSARLPEEQRPEERTEEPEEETIDFRHYIKKNLFMYLAVMILLFTLAYALGYWMAYDKAIVAVTKTFTEAFAGCVC